MSTQGEIGDLPGYERLPGSLEMSHEIVVAWAKANIS
jgi:hypothetical protein